MDASSTQPPYCATDPGFPAPRPDDLIGQNAELIGRLKLCYGADSATFEREVLVLVRRYAALVHLLPATADNYFSAPGGLFRLGLETAFFSLQGTDGHIFSGQSTISVRRHLEPRWRLATFIAGLCCDCHRVLTHVLVTDASGNQWPGYLLPLADWLWTSGVSRYYVRWRPHAVELRQLGVFALPHVVPPDVMQHLAADNDVVIPQLLASVGGIAMHRDHSVLDDLVRRSMALVIHRSLTASADRYGKPQFGSHLERYLIDALRRLAASDPGWMPNRERSRIWFARDGLFLVWPAAAEDVRRVLEDDQLRGIPKSPETILEVLLAASVVEARDATHPSWRIKPPGAKSAFEAVRLTSPAILFGSLDTAPLQLTEEVVERGTVRGEVPSAQTSVAPSEPPPPGTQLSLIESPEPAQASSEIAAPVTPVAVFDSPLPALPAMALRAPMRLHQLVRDALSDILKSSGVGGTSPHCRALADGLFVPLYQFERRGVPAAVALRALSEVRLLARPGQGPHGSPTHTFDFEGSPTTGLLIHPGAIDGFDPGARVKKPQLAV